MSNKANPKNVAVLDSNKLSGQSAYAKERQKALTALEIAKANEVFKLQKGYRFMTEGKTSKLIHPDQIHEYLNKGWKL
jgi:hypothetical protein